MDKRLPEYLSSVNSETAVVFVHGLGGAYTTWNKFANTLHKEWIESDSFHLKYDHYYNMEKEIPVFSFFAKSFLGKGIEQLSKHLDSFIKTTCRYCKNIILVCHSMGGLVARKYIVDLLNQERDLGKIKALITYATPHLGSSWANRAKAILYKPLSIFRFTSLRLLTQVNDLSKNSKLIKSVNEDWTKLGVSSKIDFLRVLGYADIIVNENSAKYEEDIENVFQFANKDHFNIIKPTLNNQDGALYVTYNYLKDFNKKIQEEIEMTEEYTEDSDMDY
ncbi:hypothetical protein [uncultured Elizabethkingia sp.]|uniref:esterase/lipase family protein n=1 Tax=uncultured Elizabethkingia sp. TaxID=432638 RepID=UPI002596C14C|nr:hypothetical protein [uncultured Elizabethkingia sp.]